MPDDALLEGVRAGRIGGVNLFRRNIRDAAQVRDLTAALQRAAAAGGLPPVPITVDQEGGAVARITREPVFPSAMALGATGDPALVERVARAVGRLLARDGITVNFAPVCDLNTEPRNPVIGTRSFGDDPQRVSPLVAAWVRGSQAAGITAVAKHFPGHGATAQDSHHRTVEVDTDLATMVRRELAPFRAAFAAGARAAMIAHVRYPRLDDAVATLSPAIASRLLRETCGFRGALVSDAIEMAGFASSGRPETLVPRAVEAGVDAILVSEDRAAGEAAWAWIAAGVRAPRIAEALARLAPLRVLAPEPSDGEDPAALAREAADRSLTVVGERLSRLAGPIRVAAFARADEDARRLERALAARFTVALGLRAVPEGAGPLVVCTWSARLDREAVASVMPALERAAVHLVLASPYDAGLAGPRPTLLTYGDVDVSLAAAADALAGIVRPSGEPPVRLELPFC